MKFYSVSLRNCTVATQETYLDLVKTRGKCPFSNDRELEERCTDFVLPRSK